MTRAVRALRNRGMTVLRPVGWTACGQPYYAVDVQPARLGRSRLPRGTSRAPVEGPDPFPGGEPQVPPAGRDLPGRSCPAAGPPTYSAPEVRMRTALVLGLAVLAGCSREDG